MPGCYIDLDGLTGGAGDDLTPGDPRRCAPEHCGGGPCVVASGEVAGAPAALAAVGPYIVWTSRTGDVVRRLDPTTDAVVDLVPYAQRPGQLAVADGLAVWVAEDGIWHCPIDGCEAGAISLIAFGPGEAEAVRGLATDGRDVYWTRDEPHGTAGELLRCAIAEGFGATPELLAPSQSHPRGVAVSPGEAGDVVWIQHGTGPEFGQVLHLDKNASSPAVITPIAVRLDFPEHIALGGSEVLWTWADPETGEGGLSRCDLGAPCAGEDLAPQREPGRPLREPAALVIDGPDVYWVNRGGGTIMRCPTAGCPGYPEVIAEGLTRPAGVAVQGECVYAIDEADGGRVLRVPRQTR